MQDVIKKSEYLEYHRCGGETSVRYAPKLLKCPVCDHEFKAGISRSSHLSKHSPEEFGL